MPASAKPGVVYLIGAGPGDPSLITVKGMELLRSCDVIAYDALISPLVMLQVNPAAELVNVGYRHKDGRRQYGMHPAVIELALAGKSIARLKSGDPFIFGRTAQELSDLKAAGLIYEIVPGITSGTAAATYGGFMLTHREHASDLTFASGHDVISGAGHTDWELLAKTKGTVVIYMGVTHLAENCKRLVALGRHPDTRVALIKNVSTAHQRVITGTLATMETLVTEPTDWVPGLIIVGDIVADLAASDWLQQKELFGLEALVIRTAPGPSRIANELEALGASVLQAPWVKPQRVALNHQELLEDLERSDVLILSSEATVAFLKELLWENGADIRLLSRCKIVCEGESARRHLAALGIRADLQTGRLESGLLSEFASGRVLAFTSNATHERLKGVLSAHGIRGAARQVVELETRFPNCEAPNPHLIILPSRRAVSLYYESCPWVSRLQVVPVLTMGETVAELARAYGAETVCNSAVHSVECLIDEVRRFKAHNGAL